MTRHKLEYGRAVTRRGLLLGRIALGSAIALGPLGWVLSDVARNGKGIAPLDWLATMAAAFAVTMLMASLSLTLSGLDYERGRLCRSAIAALVVEFLWVVFLAGLMLWRFASTPMGPFDWS